jgi:hypothetical protein
MTATPMICPTCKQSRPPLPPDAICGLPMLHCGKPLTRDLEAPRSYGGRALPEVWGCSECGEFSQDSPMCLCYEDGDI